MPRTARIVVPDVPHHITQRGNNRQDVFFVDDDRRVYLSILKEQSEQFGLEMLGWCLMTNHIHLIGRPAAQDSLAKALGRTHFRYTQYINQYHRRSGHLWQNRFFSCPLGRAHFWQALRYVEQNPVRAKMVLRAWEYPWSSAAIHIAESRYNLSDPTSQKRVYPSSLFELRRTCVQPAESKDKSPLSAERTSPRFCGDELLNMAYWKQISSAVDWRKTLGQMQSDEQVAAIRQNTHTGRPLAGDAFISKLEKLLNKRLRPLPIGRPLNTLKDGQDE